MKTLIQWLKSPALMVFVGILILSLLIWFGGPLVAIAQKEPLAGEGARFGVILILFILWGLNNLRIQRRSQKTNAQMTDELISKSNDGISDQSEGEFSILKERMNDALEVLKNARIGGKKQRLYELPWYIVIGPPGTGKTTALVNSGLHFPLKEQLGEHSIQGIGGTRNCEWWFTDQAVLIDTAGRYTTQDSHTEVDRAAWRNFLGLLKKYRPRRPLNGAIVNISLPELMSQTAAERALHARAVKLRIQELHNQLGLSFPVYVVINKVDLVEGFVEYFDDLNRAEREQIWGITFPLEQSLDGFGAVSQFKSEFSALIARLKERTLLRLNQERDTHRRTLIHDFPKQMTAVGPILDEFLHEAFAPNRYEQQALLRGVYLASGTQTGSPIDRLSEGLRQKLALPKLQTPHSGINVHGYFIHDLFQRLIFKEAALATTDSRIEKRRGLTYALSYGASALASCLFIAGFAYSYQNNLGYLDRIRQHLDGYQAVTAGGLTQQADLVTLNHGLTALRQLPTGYTNPERDHPTAEGLGLYQGDKIGQEAEQLYYRGLTTVFSTFLKNRLEQQVSNNMHHQEYLYEALKNYLMLYNKDKLDREHLTTWLSIDWQQTLPGDINKPIRDELLGHLNTLLDLNTAFPAMDERLVSDARDSLREMPLAERVYRRLLDEYRHSDIDDFRISDVLGSQAPLLFTRTSGKSFSEGIPGLFTYDGFHRIFNVENRKISNRLSNDQWIFGSNAEAQISEELMKELSQEVEQRYYADYIRYWRDLLDDMEINTSTQNDAMERWLNAATHPSEPLARFLRAVEHHTQLSRLPDTQGLSDTAKAIEQSTSLGHKTQRLQRIVGAASGSVQLELPGKPVAYEFDTLSRYLSTDGDWATANESIEGLREYYREMNGSSDEASFRAISGRRSSSHPIGAVSRQARNAPEPVRRWLTNLENRAEQAAMSGARRHLNRAWNAMVVPYYRSAIRNRYPLNPNGRQEITLEDFGNFFGHKGLLQTYFNDYLKPFVDTRRSPWRWNTNIGLSNKSLAIFEQAHRIRQAYFPSGSVMPTVEFTVKPRSLDSSASRFTLEVGDRSSSYRHGPTRVQNLIWPDDRGHGNARISFTLAQDGRTVGTQEDGPWGLFRLLNSAGKMDSRSRHVHVVTFDWQGFEAKYQINANTVNNPFNNNLLGNFKFSENL